MSVAQLIESKIRQALAPQFLELINESGSHSVPAGSETHFKLRVVAGEFEGMNRVARHRRVYELLARELAGGVHALSIEASAPSEWKDTETAASPPCLGGSKRESR